MSRSSEQWIASQDGVIDMTTTIREMEVQEMEIMDQRNEKLSTLQRQRRAGKLFIDKAVKDVEDGVLDPLDVFIVFKTMADQLTTANKEIQDLALDQAELHGAKTFSHHGYQIGVVQGRTNWDFKNCQGVVEMEAEVKRLKDGLKSMRKSADADGYSEVIELNGQKVLAAPDINGEMLALPVTKFGKSYLTIKSTH
tara:strand:+ start:1421 stop:2008 length:588 start_codon:yes stop_codon:yes gene_type:complete